MKEECKTGIRHECKTDFGYRTRHHFYSFLQKEDCDAGVNKWRDLCVTNQQLRCWNTSPPPLPSVFLSWGLASSLFIQLAQQNRPPFHFMESHKFWVWRFSKVVKKPTIIAHCKDGWLQLWEEVMNLELSDIPLMIHEKAGFPDLGPSTLTLVPFPSDSKISCLAPLEKGTARFTLL